MADVIINALPESGTSITMTQLTRVGGDLVPVPANITQGIAKRITPEFESQKTPSAAKAVNDLPNVMPNILENFASCTQLFTFACLTPQQYNDPASYRNNQNDFSKFADKGAKFVVFASAGRYDAGRVNTYHGTPEYFVDNFIIKNVIASGPQQGNSPVTTVSFDVYEPYSLGVLLESLQLAAQNAGYNSYITAPFLMRIDFQGYADDGTELSLIKSKYFPLKLQTVKFKANETGSTYKVTAIPYGDIGHSGLYNTTYSDVKITSGLDATVAGLLKTNDKDSLVNYLNRKEQTSVKQGRCGIANVYDIQFPFTSAEYTSIKDKNSQLKTGDTAGTATINPFSGPETTVITGDSCTVNNSKTLMNAIGTSQFNFDLSQGGVIPMARAGVAYDEKTAVVKKAQVSYDPTTREFQFPAGITITEIITQVVLSSDYIIKSTSDEKLKNPTVDYFMIDIQVELIDFDVMINDYAKKITYRVVPYKVNSSMFANPSTAVTNADYIKNNICKAYDYIYTGQNTDILKFDIEINNAFFKGINPSPEQQNARSNLANPDQGGVIAALSKTSNVQLGDSAQDLTEIRPALLKNAAFMRTGMQAGGNGLANTERMVGEQMHNIFIDSSSADMVKLNLEILGDPYWLSDHGIGNWYQPVSQDTPQKKEDGSMNHQDNQVYLYIRFRSPIDIDTFTGMYTFAKDIAAMKEHDFSGIYKVTACESIFSGGVFKQKLTCLREISQSVDSSNSNATKSGMSIMNIGGDQPLPSTLNEQLDLAIPPNTATTAPSGAGDMTKPQDQTGITKMMNSTAGNDAITPSGLHNLG